MNIWVTSDLHFNHQNILKFTERPFDTVEEMNEGIIAEFQSKVQPEDKVFHLGDFMMGPDKSENFPKFFDRLPGNWTFILGNHDDITIEKWQHTLIEHPRIDEIAHYKKFYHNKYLYIMFHFPIASWDSKHWRNHKNKKIKGVFHFYGHCHSTPDTKFVLDTADVGIDATGVKLLKIEEHHARVGVDDTVVGDYQHH